MKTIQGGRFDSSSGGQWTCCSGCLIGLLLLSAHAAFWWRDIVKVLMALLMTAANLIFGLFGQLCFTDVPPVREVITAFAGPTITLLCLVVIYWLALTWFGQFALPARSMGERVLAGRQTFLWSFGWHGPVGHVREGALIDLRREADFNYPGVLVVDPQSVVAFEPRLDPLRFRLPLTSRPPTPRISGTGLVFTRPFERIHSVLSLRRQFRFLSEKPSKPPAKGRTADGREVLDEKPPRPLTGRTADGLEVSTRFFSIFSLCQPPDVLRVVRKKGRLYVLQTDRSNRITAFLDTLDADDARQIENDLRDLSPRLDLAAPLYTAPVGPDIPPFEIDAERRERIFAAAFRQAENARNGDRVDWGQTPNQVALERFRSLLEGVSLDSLYTVDPPGATFPRGSFRSRVSAAVRNQGVLSYQYLARYDRQSVEVGQEITDRDFFIAPVRPLTAPKLLRARGIKVVYSGFADLSYDSVIERQRIESWMANWQVRIQAIRAVTDAEIAQTCSEVCADAEREMLMALTELFRNPNFTEEALAVRVFEELSRIAGDPETRQNLTPETISTLQLLAWWLSPDRTPWRV